MPQAWGCRCARSREEVFGTLNNPLLPLFPPPQPVSVPKWRRPDPQCSGAKSREIGEGGEAGKEAEGQRSREGRRGEEPEEGESVVEDAGRTTLRGGAAGGAPPPENLLALSNRLRPGPERSALYVERPGEGAGPRLGAGPQEPPEAVGRAGGGGSAR